MCGQDDLCPICGSPEELVDGVCPSCGEDYNPGPGYVGPGITRQCPRCGEESDALYVPPILVTYWLGGFPVSSLRGGFCNACNWSRCIYCDDEALPHRNYCAVHRVVDEDDAARVEDTDVR